MKTKLLSPIRAAFLAAGVSLPAIAGPPDFPHRKAPRQSKPRHQSPAVECGLCRVVALTRLGPHPQGGLQRVKTGEMMICPECSRSLEIRHGKVSGSSAHTCSIFLGNPPECCVELLGGPQPRT